jgi:hypothetical protein
MAAEIWEHFVVDGPSPEIAQPPQYGARPVVVSAEPGP